MSMPETDLPLLTPVADQEDAQPSESRPARADVRTASEPGEEERALLLRIERRLSEIRNALEATQRSQRHKEYSAPRLVGAVLEAIVVALLAWALSDWVFDAPAAAILIKLGFASVLQLGALTAFVVTRADASTD